MHGHMKVGAKIGENRTQDKDYPEMQEAGGGKEGVSSKTTEGSMALPTS